MCAFCFMLLSIPIHYRTPHSCARLTGTVLFCYFITRSTKNILSYIVQLNDHRALSIEHWILANWMISIKIKRKTKSSSIQIINNSLCPTSDLFAPYNNLNFGGMGWWMEQKKCFELVSNAMMIDHGIQLEKATQSKLFFRQFFFLFFQFSFIWFFGWNKKEERKNKSKRNFFSSL